MSAPLPFFNCALSGSQQGGRPHHHIVVGGNTFPVSSGVFDYLKRHMTPLGEDQGNIQDGVVVLTSTKRGVKDFYFTQSALCSVHKWKRGLDDILAGRYTPAGNKHHVSQSDDDICNENGNLQVI